MVIAVWLDVMLPFLKTRARLWPLAVLNSAKLLTLCSVVITMRPHLKYYPVDILMKIVSSLKTLKNRDRNCQIVRRRGRLYVINKKNPRFKARQG